ncbi:DUF4287 domain-containing protein [Flavobacteriaceae bacterium M23B6Z8]
MDAALQTMIDNMPEKTGKSLEEWKKTLEKKSFEKYMEAVKYLKEEHKVTHGYATTIVSLSKDDQASTEDLVTEQYKGKEALLPLYGNLLKIVTKFGDDVVIAPKKTSVSVRRKRQFVLIKPATKTRIDLGLKLPGKPVSGRLENSGPFGTMCTHRVKLESADEIDKELIGWLKEAYEMAS